MARERNPEFPSLLGTDDGAAATRVAVRDICEFGCGNGSAVLPLLRGDAKARVTAVDFRLSKDTHTQTHTHAHTHT